MKRLLGTAAIAAALVLPSIAQANTLNPQLPQSPDGIQGTIASIDGEYGLTVRDISGSLERVELHRGTIIEPTGLQLKPGMLVTIYGRPAGADFRANAIDAPIQASIRQAQHSRAPFTAPVPAFAPNGTFETAGPTAEGGG